MPVDGCHRPERRQKPYLALCGWVSVLAAGLVVYSQTAALAWDEGFHLLAAQLIKAGKRPYLDFIFSQPPLNAYWNAGWMWVFGESWRVVHAVAALLTAGAVLLTADYLFARLPEPRWRVAAALAASFAMGLNATVVGYGAVGQAYGLCLFLIAAAFRLAVVAAGRKGLALPAAAGLLAGAAAASSLLTAPVAPVVALWMLVYERTGRRWAKFAAFLGAAAVPFLPVVALYLKSPRQVLFGVIEYNLFYRGVQWERATRHNFEVLISWIDSSQALLLGLLAAAGLLFVHFRSGWDRPERAEFYLCGWLALALGLHISTAHPTFQRYYLLLVPFLAILAAVGLCWISSRLYSPDRLLPGAFLLGLLVVLGLAKSLYEDRDEPRWRDLEAVAGKVDQVTPRDGLLLADEQVYFLTRRRPPSGLELRDSQKLEFPAARAESLHLVPGSELRRRVQAGLFDTVQTCEGDVDIPAFGLDRLYSRQARVGICAVFWDRTPAPAGASGR
jgi:4-amino-4-deoxy-L-arabinose transferase-like glycosyltransferase